VWTAVAESQNARDLIAYITSLEPSTRIRGVVSLGQVESLVGVNAFLSGPHRNGEFDFDSTTEFGHYDPEFLRRVLDTVLGDNVPAEAMRTLVVRLPLFRAFHERVLSLSAARCYMRQAPERFAEFQREYADGIAKGERFSAYGKLSKWNDFHAGYGAEDLAFWARRDWDGTSDLVAEGLGRILRELDFSTYHARVGCLRNAPASLLFTTESFLDHRNWGDPSALACREKLIEQHAWSDPRQWDGKFLPRTAPDARIADPAEIARRLSAAGCPESLIHGPHFALVAEEGRMRWEPLDLELTLEFTHFDACYQMKLVDLRIRTKYGAEAPLLLSAGKPPAAPGPFTDARWDVAIERGPRPETPGTDTEVILKATLWAELQDGRKTKIEERHGVGGGDYGYAEPSIDAVTVLDVNGDGGPDFLYRVDTGGRYLVLTRDGEIFDTITLVTDQYSGVGGC
jgi:hypothetical protein